ncbi:MerR family transcriptional regulator [Streptomyces armeniacus]|uniref:MerR family transcriptional regulator n=1 Tax=Streptomyces armeniacus TaxID=83291 RepID=A0A345XR73_9ACTN|nr:MerR family transcriptional regulator [Streptomyces armeniacus]AXK34139.1 MerR family transcriptional regulator [Streptomyces armeniacus]
MNDRSELFTIGQLSARTGIPVRTIRYWSDLGLIPPTARSAGGYRCYGVEDTARADLVRTLRELGLGLETVRWVLDGQAGIADVARQHARALDAEIRTLKLRRAVLRSVAERHDTTEEMALMHKLAQLSAEERTRIIDDFVDRTFAGIDPEAQGAQLAHAMRTVPAELPEDPTTEQVDAWVELAELVGDPDFRQRVRQMAVAGAEGTPEPASADAPAGTAGTDGRDGPAGTDSPAGPAPLPYDPARVTEHAGAAVAAGTAPDGAGARTVLHRIVDADMPRDERARLADQVETFTDRRVERYWQLLGVLNGRPPFPPAVPAFEWFIAALRGA